MNTFYPPILCRGHSFEGKNTPNSENAFHFYNFKAESDFQSNRGKVYCFVTILTSKVDENIVFFLISHNFVQTAGFKNENL